MTIRKQTQLQLSWICNLAKRDCAIKYLYRAPTEHSLNSDESHQRVPPTKTIRNPARQHCTSGGANEEACFHITGYVVGTNQTKFLHQRLCLPINVGELEELALCVVQITCITGPINQLTLLIGHLAVIDVQQLAPVCSLAEIAPQCDAQFL